VWQKEQSGMKQSPTEEEHACCTKMRLGRPPQMQADAREAAILRATAQLLLETSFDAVTMAAVSAKAGMSKRTVYEHFKNREDLFVRAIECILRTVFLPLRDEDRVLPLRERLSLLLRYNEAPSSDQNSLEFLRSIVAKAQTYPVLAQKLHSNGRGALAGYVRTEVLRAIASGEIALAASDLDMAIEVLLDMAFENTLIRLLHPNAPTKNAAMGARRRDFAITLFLRGCAP
jgi:AcrR family transcriptional regulator